MFELTQNVSNKDKTELIDILKITRTCLPDARDVDGNMATPIWGGAAIGIQEERIPKFFRDDHEEIAAKEKITELNNNTQKNVLHLKSSHDIFRNVLCITRRVNFLQDEGR